TRKIVPKNSGNSESESIGRITDGNRSPHQKNSQTTYCIQYYEESWVRYCTVRPDEPPTDESCGPWELENTEMIDEVCIDGETTDPCLDPENVGSGDCGSGGSGSGSGSGTGGSTNFYYDPAMVYNSVGDKPIHEFQNKCTGLQFMWNNYTNNEVNGYITSAGNLIVTDILPYSGGAVHGLYEFDGIVYYTWPSSNGQPTVQHPDLIVSGPNYFIPVVASIHTHTPCRNDGTNGVSHSVSSDDKNLASTYPGLNLWVIGCGAIAQYGTGNNFFNVQNGDLSILCNSIQ